MEPAIDGVQPGGLIQDLLARCADDPVRSGAPLFAASLWLRARCSAPTGGTDPDSTDMNNSSRLHFSSSVNMDLYKRLSLASIDQF